MPLFLVAVAAALPGRALEFAALGEERASRVGESATGVDGIPPAEATPCKKKGDWKCKFKAMRIERNALRAELEALKPQTLQAAAPDSDAYKRICGLADPAYEFTGKGVTAPLSATEGAFDYTVALMYYPTEAELSHMMLTLKNNWEDFLETQGANHEYECIFAIDSVISSRTCPGTDLSDAYENVRKNRKVIAHSDEVY